MAEQPSRRVSLDASCPNKGLRRSLVVAGLLLASACINPEGGDTYEAWFRPLSGFCPRYVIGEDYAWIRGKVAPTHQRKGVRQQVYTFRGEFLKDSEGNPKVSTKCQGRPYPIFELYEVVGSRALEEGEKPPGAADAAARSGQLVESKEKARERAAEEAKKLENRDFALPTAPASLTFDSTPQPSQVPTGVKSIKDSVTEPPAVKRKSIRRQGRTGRLKSRNRRSQ